MWSIKWSMATGLLSDAKLRNMPVGTHHDGGGLYCIVRSATSASWHVRYTVKRRPDLGRPKMGLGSYPEISLTKAREEAMYNRALAAQGIDPVEHRRNLNRQAMTVRETFEEMFKVKKKFLKGDGKNGRWMSPVENHIFPALGDVPIARLTVQLIVDKLGAVYLDKPQTGDKVFNRLKQALIHASAQDERVEPTILERAKAQLPRQKSIKKSRDDGHHPPLYWQDAPKLWMTLDESVTDTALAFYLLTLPRVSNVINMRWAQIDVKKGIWTIPPEDVKTGVAFDAPLTKTALALLRRAKRFALRDSGDLVFPNSKARNSKRLFHVNFLNKRLKRDKWESTMPGKLAVAHGTRATFRTWCAEPFDKDSTQPKVERDLAELCIQHEVMSKIERSYQRSSLIVRRRKVLELWEDHVLSSARKRIATVERNAETVLVGNGPGADPIEMTRQDFEAQFRPDPGDE